jgi:hypothetical protein
MYCTVFVLIPTGRHTHTHTQTRKDVPVYPKDLLNLQALRSGANWMFSCIYFAISEGAASSRILALLGDSSHVFAHVTVDSMQPKNSSELPQARSLRISRSTVFTVLIRNSIAVRP